MILYCDQVFLDGSFRPATVHFEQTITEIREGVKEEGAQDLTGFSLIPGLIDIHTHGAVGADASDGDLEGLREMSLYYARGGVTSWCPTTMTLKEPDLLKAVIAARKFERPEGGAKIAGLHLEGPFVSAEKCGAQNPDNIKAPDLDLLRRLNEASGGLVKLITMAPETEGGISFIRKAKEICTVSVGHTTADYDTALSAFQAGASHTTHLFNAMPGIHHRNPGVIPAALSCGASGELITDGLHIHPAIVRMAFQLFQEKLVLISDSLRCSGMPDGEYPFGGQFISLKEGKACLRGSTTIAGSIIHLSEGVRRAVSFGIPLEKAIYAASLAPAKVIGMDREIGSIATGKRADLCVLDKNLMARQVYVEGKPSLPEP